MHYPDPAGICVFFQPRPLRWAPDPHSSLEFQMQLRASSPVFPLLVEPAPMSGTTKHLGLMPEMQPS